MLIKENNIKKNEKGITLLALIVTIIVLMILAGISIAMLVGDNGIMNNAVTTKRVTHVSSKMEKIKLAISSAKIAGRGKVDETELKKELTSYFGVEGTDYQIAGSQNSGYWLVVTDDNITDDDAYFIKASGELEQKTMEEAEVALIDAENKANSYAIALVDDLGTRSTIYLYGNPNKEVTTSITTANTASPTGSTVTNTDAIIDTPSYEANLTNAANYVTYTVNYVTYTVNKNGTYKFNVTAGGDTTETTVVVKNIEQFTSIETLASQEGLSYAGGKTNAYTYKGAVVPKGYYVDTNSNVDTGLVVTDDVDSEGYSIGNEWVWVPVNSSVGNDDYYGEEAQATALAGATSVTYTKYSKLYSFMDKTRESYEIFHPYGTNTGTLSRPSTTSSPQYREIAVLTDYSYGETGKYNLVNNRTTGTAFANVTDVATQYRDDYETMVASVDNYKGFYIGRYEITQNGEKPGTSLTNTKWYTFYNQCLTMGNSYTESGMIYGCLWDATMQWLTTADYSVGYTGNTYSGYGNYNSEAVKVNNDDITITIKSQGTIQKLATGQTSYTKSNNIFDLSGNCVDWTQEAYSTRYRVSRGGEYNNSGSSYTYSAIRINYTPTGTYVNVSSRPHFYIK